MSCERVDAGLVVPDHGGHGGVTDQGDRGKVRRRQRRPSARSPSPTLRTRRSAARLVLQAHGGHRRRRARLCPGDAASGGWPGSIGGCSAAWPGSGRTPSCPAAVRWTPSMNQEPMRPALAVRQSRIRSSGHAGRGRPGPGWCPGTRSRRSLRLIQATRSRPGRAARAGPGRSRPQRSVVVAQLDDHQLAEATPLGLDCAEPARRPGALSGDHAAQTAPRQATASTTRPDARARAVRTLRRPGQRPSHPAGRAARRRRPTDGSQGRSGHR